MNVLVTGGAGYIGSHTAVALLDAGHEVAVVDNYVNSSAEAISRVEKITGKSVSLYEAAEIDGANKTQQFRFITIPLVSQTTFYLLIVRMIAVFKVFTSVNVLTWKTSSKGSVSIVQEVYSTAFGDFNFGKGSAQSWVLVGIILIFTFIQFRGQKKWVHY